MSEGSSWPVISGQEFCIVGTVEEAVESGRDDVKDSDVLSAC